MFTWLTSLAAGLSEWMVSPWMLLGGCLLVAVPIVIHLLNKRKYISVDWAAMDFLLEADKMDRRRIRLEDLLLLLLRCLAVLLLALLLARPFWPSTFAGGALQSVRFERIVILDDSLSMQVFADGSSAFDVAKQAIADLVGKLGEEESDESFSLVLLSRPERPLISGVQLGDDTTPQLTQDILGLKTSDVQVRLPDALLEVEKMVENEPEKVNRILYVFSDLRVRDWTVEESGEKETNARQTLTRLANKSAGCYIVDTGSDATNNLVITDVVPQEKVLLSGVRSEFNVTVKNVGSLTVRNVPLRFTAGESLPLTRLIEQIPPGSSATVPFSFTFARDESALSTRLPNSADLAPTGVPLRVSLVTDDLASSDLLLEDNERFYAARIVDGIRTLVVDGDPSAAYGRAESFSLRRALAPPGAMRSGINVDIVTDVEFDGTRLQDYEVIYVCNLYRLTEQRRTGLEEWVEHGGGLVMFVGDQIDEHVYNETLYRDGSGLLPARLDGVMGDETEETWVHFRVQGAHPTFGIFAGENNPFVNFVKIFRWWKCQVDDAQQNAGQVVVSARFSDTANSPAAIEKKFGDGRVMLLTTPVDRDWNDWPLDASYVVATQELTRYMVNKKDREGTSLVGEPIRHPVDLTKYRLDVSVRDPNHETSPVEPKPATGGEFPDTGGARPGDETQWIVDHDEVHQRGFYELQMTRSDGGTDRVLFAANVDATEGDLERVQIEELKSNLSDAPIQIVTAASLAGLTARGAEGELWPLVLAMVAGLLCGEQLLGWAFGRKR